MPERNLILLICFFIAAASLIAFWQVGNSEFINFDDDVYVTENPRVQRGLTLEGIRWALTGYYASNWHPLTWMSHMLDVQLFGLSPRGHHLTNLLLHVANALLLFLVLHRMTKALWQSAFVAVLFALHPLHVESVAWVAERKDVLSGLFWMLTMGAYVFYVERPGLPRYLAVVLFFALGLMAKPMVVTLPFVLLLLDVWPLKRLEPGRAAGGPRTEPVRSAPAEKKKGKAGKKQPVKIAPPPQPPAAAQDRWALIGPLLREKIPLFALTAMSCVVTYLAQQAGGAVAPIEAFPLGDRIANALVSYVLYIWKMVWPVGLAVLYPHPGSLPLWQVLGAGFVLAAVTSFAIWRVKKSPCLAVGWLWYLGTLVPVIGIVQVGGHALADRYAYIPLIGVFVAAAWGIPELFGRWRWRKEALVASSALILLGLVTVTWKQVGYWQNSITLYDHALEVTDRNSLIYNNRGAAYNDLGRLDRAIADFDRAIEINPRYDKAYYNRGNALGQKGDFDRAIADFDRAVGISPRYAAAYFNRGNAHGEKGRLDRAIADFDRVIEISPDHAGAYSSRGFAYLSLKDRDKGCLDFRQACQRGDCRGYENARRAGVCP